MTETQDWHWLPQWAPTFAVVVALLAAVVPASFHLGGELARLGGEIDRLDEGQAELKAGQARLEARLDSLAMRMESLLGELRTEMRADRAALADVRAGVRSRGSPVGEFGGCQRAFAGVAGNETSAVRRGRGAMSQ